MESIDICRAAVLVAHVEPLLSIGLARSLEERPGLHVFVDGGAPPDRPIDVVLTDPARGLRMAAAQGAGAAAREPRILVVANEARERDVRLALACGVHGYMLGASSPDEVADGVRSLARGQHYVCRAVARCVADSVTRDMLTAREAEVLALVAQGCANKVIARQLDIAVGTVKQHVKGILSKLQASSRTHAVSIAIVRGLVDRAPP